MSMYMHSYTLLNESKLCNLYASAEISNVSVYTQKQQLHQGISPSEYVLCMSLCAGLKTKKCNTKATVTASY